MSQQSSNHTLALTVAAGLAGAGIALLFAPRTGRETRAKLRNSANDLKEQADDKMAAARDTLQDGIEQARGLKRRLTSKAKKAEHTAKNMGRELAKEPAAIRAASWEEEV